MKKHLMTWRLGRGAKAALLSLVAGLALLIGILGLPSPRRVPAVHDRHSSERDRPDSPQAVSDASGEVRLEVGRAGSEVPSVTGEPKTTDSSSINSSLGIELPLHLRKKLVIGLGMQAIEGSQFAGDEITQIESLIAAFDAERSVCASARHEVMRLLADTWGRVESIVPNQPDAVAPDFPGQLVLMRHRGPEGVVLRFNPGEVPELDALVDREMVARTSAQHVLIARFPVRLRVAK